MTEDKKEKLLNFFNDKNKKIIIIIGIVAIIIIFFSSIFPSSGKSPSKEPTVSKTSAQEYSKQLEETLVSIISSIDGAGKSKVMVTLENGTEVKYATQGKTNSETIQQGTGSSSTQTKQSGDTQTEYIIIKNSDGTETALEITEFEPTVKGVVVVCAGGESPVVQQRIINAVTTALNISSKKVCVTRLSE